MRKVEVGVLFCMLFSVGLGLGVSQTKANREQQIQAHSQKAAEYLQNSRPDLAMPELRAILTIDPNNADAHGNLGAVLFFLGSYQDAIPQLRAALKLKPRLWKTQALLGMAERRTAETQAARLDLEKAFPNLTEKKIQIQAGIEINEIFSPNRGIHKTGPTKTNPR